jgi:hypothetical protein
MDEPGVLVDEAANVTTEVNSPSSSQSASERDLRRQVTCLASLLFLAYR